MPEMAKGCRMDPREWHDRSRRPNRSPDCPPSALIGQNGRIESRRVSGSPRETIQRGKDIVTKSFALSGIDGFFM